jgi:hypothetical protein
MTTFYCPNCWRELSEHATICPHCHEDISERISQADYTDKLIAALRHKEPTAPVRAAWVLGERREGKAVAALTKVVRKAKDAFLVESAVEAAWENRRYGSDNGSGHRDSASKFACSRESA